MKATDDPGMGALQRYMCKRERSYKHPSYTDVMAGIDKKGGAK
jgi:hypothetical protein